MSSAVASRPLPLCPLPRTSLRPQRRTTVVCSARKGGRSALRTCSPLRRQSRTRRQLSALTNVLRALFHAGSLYDILGVSESATEREIKSAYRKKALKLHPDVNKAPDAQQQFMEAKTAFETLVDPKQRAEYDRRYRMVRKPTVQTITRKPPCQYTRALIRIAGQCYSVCLTSMRVYHGN